MQLSRVQTTHTSLNLACDHERTGKNDEKYRLLHRTMFCFQGEKDLRL